MKKCMFLAVTGELPRNDECVCCEKCRFYLEELSEPKPGHENDKDELPY